MHATLAGALHAAGVLRDKMVRSMVVGEIDGAFAPKGHAASFVRSTVTRQLMEVVGLVKIFAMTIHSLRWVSIRPSNRPEGVEALCRGELGDRPCVGLSPRSSSAAMA